MLLAGVRGSSLIRLKSSRITSPKRDGSRRDGTAEYSDSDLGSAQRRFAADGTHGGSGIAAATARSSLPVRNLCDAALARPMNDLYAIMS